jgi:hypothetical protein
MLFLKQDGFMNRAFLKIIISIFGCVLAFFGCILAYGYWHSSTHAQFDVTLNFKNINNGNSLPFLKAEIAFLDSKRRILASGKVEEKFHYVQLIHPQVGNCYEKAKSIPSSKKSRKIWQECYKHLPSWISQWVDEVSQVDIKTSNCTIRKIPVTVKKYNSHWWLWWVPLPHVGGKPYSYYSTRITIDKMNCEN